MPGPVAAPTQFQPFFWLIPHVMSNPLLQMENVVCTPHVAGVTNETVQRRGQAGAEKVDRVARGLPALHLVTDVESMAH